jgi:hypothetical protein
MSWREMQVLPQALPLWQILQHVCAVRVERVVRPAEWADDECDAHRVLWMDEGNGPVAVVDDGEGGSARADVVRDRRRRTTRVRNMPLLSLSVRVCIIRRMPEHPVPVMLRSPGRRSQNQEGRDGAVRYLRVGAKNPRRPALRDFLPHCAHNHRR